MSVEKVLSFINTLPTVVDASPLFNPNFIIATILIMFVILVVSVFITFGRKSF